MAWSYLWTANSPSQSNRPKDPISFSDVLRALLFLSVRAPATNYPRHGAGAFWHPIGQEFTESSLPMRWRLSAISLIVVVGAATAAPIERERIKVRDGDTVSKWTGAHIDVVAGEPTRQDLADDLDRELAEFEVRHGES
jgi:hypothetical protein